MKNIAIYGSSYLEIIRLIKRINYFKKSYKIIGFLNDKEELQNRIFYGYEVLGGQEKIKDLKRHHKNLVFCHNVNSTLKDRKIVSSILEKNKCQVESLISPEIDQSYTTIGRGAVLVQGCLLGMEACVGQYLTTRYGAIISHNTVLGDYVYVGLGAKICGFANIGSGCYIGAGAVILPKIKIGPKTIIGAGSVVTKDIGSGVIACGVPAKIIKKRPSDSYRGKGM